MKRNFLIRILILISNNSVIIKNTKLTGVLFVAERHPVCRNVQSTAPAPEGPSVYRKRESDFVVPAPEGPPVCRKGKSDLAVPAPEGPSVYRKRKSDFVVPAPEGPPVCRKSEDSICNTGFGGAT